MQHSRIILFKLKFHHRTSCDWLNKSLINPHWAFCSKQIFEQYKKEECCAAHFYRQQYYICRTSQGEIGILPLDPLCSLCSDIQRSSSRFFINGGGYAPLERFCNLLQNRPQTPDGFARLRSTSQHAASGLQEFILQTTLTSARGPDRACCCWLAISCQPGIIYNLAHKEGIFKQNCTFLHFQIG